MIQTFLTLFIFIHSCFSQNDDIENIIRYDNFIYNNNIHTVQIFRKGNELSYPIIQLNSTDTLQVCFDDFNLNMQNYYYTIIHCDINWQPSNINFYDYAAGLQFCPVTHFYFSFNTIKKYIHYEIFVPNENLQILKSGNYLLIVYDQNKTPLFSLKFFIYEPLINIEADVFPSQVTEYRKTHHQLKIKLKPFFNCQNPSEEIKIIISQNFRFDNAKTITNPTFILNDEIVYDNYYELLFEAGNEFRWFDAKDVRFQNQTTQNISFKDSFYLFILYPEERRAFNKYINWQDINGKFLIKNNLARNSHTEADYIKVKFIVPLEYTLTHANLYIAGYFNFWKFTKENMLKYNATSKAYETELYLKQGFYNYQILLYDDNKKSAETEFYEGNFSDTENEYLIFVYWKKITTNYWSLVGIKSANSIIK
ncbi:MAG: DUF5103 domain-containing protein [Bacteroidales bacterium]|nr:DUF5103 domain-containing protein [Bacteroidales bacterium]